MLVKNLGRLEFLASDVIFCCWVFQDFRRDFWVCDVIDLLMMQISIEDICLDRRHLVLFYSFEVRWNYLLLFFMTLQRIFFPN